MQLGSCPLQCIEPKKKKKKSLQVSKKIHLEVWCQVKAKLAASDGSIRTAVTPMHRLGYLGPNTSLTRTQKHSLVPVGSRPVALLLPLLLPTGWAGQPTPQAKPPHKPARLHAWHQPPRAGTLSEANRFWTRKIFTGEKSWSARDQLNAVGFFINLFLLLAFFYIEMQVPRHCSLKTRQTRTGTPPPPAFVLPTRGLRALLLYWTAWAIHFLDFISILNTTFVNFNIFLNFDRHLYHSGCEKLPFNRNTFLIAIFPSASPFLHQLRIF